MSVLMPLPGSFGRGPHGKRHRILFILNVCLFPERGRERERNSSDERVTHPLGREPAPSKCPALPLPVPRSALAAGALHLPSHTCLLTAAFSHLPSHTCLPTACLYGEPRAAAQPPRTEGTWAPSSDGSCEDGALRGGTPSPSLTQMQSGSSWGGTACTRRRIAYLEGEGAGCASSGIPRCV